MASPGTLIMSCCQCEGIEQEFNDDEARKMLKRFRRRGPDRTTQLLIDGVREALAHSDGSGTTTLLDIGAGIGAIHHELLTKDVDRVVHVDASSAHLAVAREETARCGHAGSVEFVRGDFVDIADRVVPADVVTLDRVICCYDDMPRLVRLSAEHARRFFGAVYPRGTFWMRTGVVVINLIMRIKRSPFRTFHHDPVEIDAVLRSTGLRRRLIQRRLGWEVVVYERP